MKQNFCIRRFMMSTDLIIVLRLVYTVQLFSNSEAVHGSALAAPMSD